MGQDLLKWDEGGVLKHHCPICQTPLSHEKCRTTCLGKHVEWCHRYHSLFRMTWATRCHACRTCDEQHEKRHRDIAEILHRIKKIRAEDEAVAMEQLVSPMTPKTPRTPLTAKALNIIGSSPLPASDGAGQRTTKKERKAAKKVAKAMDRDKFVTTAEIVRVAKTLHPEPEKEAEKADIEAEGMAEDEEIRWNLRFNYSTCNSKSIRHDYIVKERSGQLQVPEVDMESLLEQLDVDIDAVGKEGELVEELVKAIKSDLQNFHDEVQTTARSKAGFWRWANKKHYRVLLDRGKEWTDKHKPMERTESDASDERRDSAVSTEPEVEGDSSASSSRRGSIGVPSLTKSAGNSSNGTISTVSSTPGGLQSAKRTPLHRLQIPPAPVKSADSAPIGNSDWTQVGKKLLKPPPKGKITLAGNGGLKHLHQKPKGKFGALSWADAAKGE